jgi:hypothetical protein
VTPLTERLLHLLKLAGPSGISGDELFRIVYDGQLPRYQGGHRGKDEQRQRSALKALVWRLNMELQYEGLQVVGEKCAGGWYQLKRIASRPGPSRKSPAT